MGKLEKWMVFLVLLIVLSSAVNLITAFQRHSYANSQFCRNDTTEVAFLTQQLANVEKSDIKPKFVVRWERQRTQYVAFIEAIANGAPCHISYTIPPDPLAS